MSEWINTRPDPFLALYSHLLDDEDDARGRGREWKYKKLKIRGLLGLGEYINCQLKIPKVKMKRVEGVCTDADSPPWGRDGWIQWPRFLRVCQLAKKPECLICKNYHKCVFHVLWKNIANVERGKFVNLFAFWCRNTCTMKYLMKRKPCFSKIQILSSFKGLPPCDLSALKKNQNNKFSPVFKSWPPCDPLSFLPNNDLEEISSRKIILLLLASWIRQLQQTGAKTKLKAPLSACGFYYYTSSGQFKWIADTYDCTHMKAGCVRIAI